MQTYEQLAQRLRLSTVQVLSRRGGGSGVVWDDRGMIVSNAHVVRGPEADIVFAGGRQVRGRVIKRDDRKDLVVVETESGLAPPASIGNSGAVRAGELAIAVGNPLGVIGAVSAGMVHAVGPVWHQTGRNWVQADVRLAPGNSGGILANADGEVIGINTMVWNGLGLAIPSNDAADFVRGETSTVRLGVEMVPVREGLVVVAIERGSLAERARMTIGDVILCSPEKLRSLLTDVSRSGIADISVLHGGQPKTLRVHLRSEAKAA